jgi:hypothetical protein
MQGMKEMEKGFSSDNKRYCSTVLTCWFVESNNPACKESDHEDGDRIIITVTMLAERAFTSCNRQFSQVKGFRIQKSKAKLK